jgi:hypothetical protein
MARRRSDLAKADNGVSSGGGLSARRGASPDPTLDELAQKLSDLREHLRQVLTGLDRGLAGGRAHDAGAAESGLRCHACNRNGSTDQAGWTLRLCADDELHPLCPDCDRRHLDRKNGSRPDVSFPRDGTALVEVRTALASDAGPPL